MNGTVGSASSSLIMPIFTTGFNMSPILVGWAMTIPRLIDAFIDPFVGHWSDQTHTRWGRRKPFLFAGALLCAMTSVLFWWMPRAWSETSQFIYLLTASIVFWVAYAIYTVPANGLAFEVSDNYQDRVRVMTARGIYCTVPALAVGWVYWLALRPIFSDEITGIRWVSLAVAAAILGCGWAPLFLVRERFANRVDNRQPLLQALRGACGSRYFLHFMALVFVLAMASAIYSGLFFYVNAYYVCGGNKSMAIKIAALTGTISTLCAFAVLPFAPAIGRRRDKRFGLCLGCGLMFLHALLQPFILRPDLPYLQVVAALVYAPGTAFYGTFLGSFLADICDLDDVAHGHRREGLFGAVYAFVKKIEISLCALLAGYLVTMSGFSAEFVQQSETTLLRLRWFTFLPYIVLTAAGLWLAWKFPITRAMADEARTVLARRGASKSG